MQTMLTRSFRGGEELIIDPPRSMDLQGGDLLLSAHGLRGLVEDLEILSAVRNTTGKQSVRFHRGFLII